MAHDQFAAAIRAWLADRHGASHPLYGYWVQDHLGKVEWVAAHHVPILGRHVKLDGARILDLGCGTGAACVAFALLGMFAVGVDCTRQMLDLARLRAGEDGVRPYLLQADAFALPFADESFELCCCNQVVEHVANPMALLSEVYRVLRPGGLLLIALPHRLALREGHTGLFFASWLPHDWAGRYAVLRGRRGPDETWDVWLEMPWSIRRRLRTAGFQELESPWRPPQRASADRGGLQRRLAGLGALRRMVRAGFRWRQFLCSTLTFVVSKPTAEHIAEGTGVRV